MKISNIKKKILSDKWKPLKLFSYDYTRNDGRVEKQHREVYDKGDGAAVLMYNPTKKKILLTKQFRMPTFINGVENGVMTEVPAGMLDKDDPETCIIKEIEEETGYKISSVKKVLDCFMTPGAVTEITHMFLAVYDDAMKISKGGGLDVEQEDIEVFEMHFSQVKASLLNNEFNDAKTIILLQYALLHKLLEY